MKEVYNSTCKETLGESNRKHEEWISKASVDKINKIIKKKAQVNESRTRKAKAEAKEYRKASKEAKKSVRSDKEDFTRKVAEKAKKIATVGNMQILYQTTKILTGKFNS